MLKAKEPTTVPATGVTYDLWVCTNFTLVKDGPVKQITATLALSRKLPNGGYEASPTHEVQTVIHNLHGSDSKPVAALVATIDAVAEELAQEQGIN